MIASSRVGVVARPKAVLGRPETERRGTFKKASNLNFTLRLVDAVAALERASMPHEAAIEAALTRRLGDDHRRSAYARGELVVGEVVLLLDKTALLTTFGRDQPYESNRDAHEFKPRISGAVAILRR